MSHGHHSAFDIFRTVTREYLMDEVRKLGYEPSVLSAAIERALDTAIEDLEEQMMKGELRSTRDRIARAIIEDNALSYVRAVLSQDRIIGEVRDFIKAYSALVIVGAGISFESGVPLTSHLKKLVTFCDLADFSQLSTNKQAALKFQTEFKKICDNKTPSASHNTIADHLGGKILEVISLNWDNLIERALIAKKKSVTKINQEVNPVTTTGNLWKFHGDVDEINTGDKHGQGGWVFPHEKGLVFNCFINYIQRPEGIKSSIFVVIISGYGEADEEITSKVINVLEQKRPTYRIVLNLRHLNKEGFIVGPSDFILPKLFT